MKLDPHIEIDRLLRRHAQQQSRLAPVAFAAPNETERDGGEAVRAHDGIAHLDADELSAYAENALPQRTRARYTEHLADCDSCRKLVTGLVMSSGVAVELERQAATHAAAASSSSSSAPARSWRDWMSAIFAPTRLRYAAFGLVLIGITSIAVMIFRDRRAGFETTQTQPSQVSQKQSSAGNSNTAAPLANAPKDSGGNAVSTSSSPTPDGISKTEATPAPAPQRQGQENDSPTSTGDLQKSGTLQGPAGTPASPAPPVASSNNPDAVKNPARDEDKVAATEQSNLSAPSVAQNKAKKEIQLDGQDSSRELERTQTNRERASSARSAESADNKTQSGKPEESAGGRKASRRAEPPAPKDVPASSAGAASGAAMDDRADKADRPAKSEEKKSAGGKQFVRRGGAWVDTVYRSQATTNVRRGSEQYRALAADEPGLRDIVNQFGGEVIIVWKGRAYRIR